LADRIAMVVVVVVAAAVAVVVVEDVDSFLKVALVHL